MWKNFVSSYLDFTKKERIGIITILGLVVSFTAIPFSYHYFIPQKTYSHTAFEKEIAALKIKQDDSNKYRKKNFDENNYQNYYEPSAKNYTIRQQWKGELFEFDPNTLNENGWKKLGLREKTIATIQNYVSKGGRFYKPEDIGKIWGLKEEEVLRMLPLIKIDDSKFKTNDGQKTFTNATYDKPKYTPTLVDINNADTTSFIALPGIGSKLAQRIITFRDKLGGFYKIEQVGETFGLQDSVFQKIKPRLVLGNNAVKKINLNSATLEELKAHPYFRYQIANAIIQYRSQHGNFSNPAEVKKIILVSEEIYNKAAPYLTVN